MDLLLWIDTDAEPVSNRRWEKSESIDICVKLIIFPLFPVTWRSGCSDLCDLSHRVAYCKSLVNSWSRCCLRRHSSQCLEKATDEWWDLAPHISARCLCRLWNGAVSPDLAEETPEVCWYCPSPQSTSWWNFCFAKKGGQQKRPKYQTFHMRTWEAEWDIFLPHVILHLICCSQRWISNCEWRSHVLFLLEVRRDVGPFIRKTGENRDKHSQ